MADNGCPLSQVPRDGLLPVQVLTSLAGQMDVHLLDAEFARRMDRRDNLAHMRRHFQVPKMKNIPGVDLTVYNPEDECIYLCGHSLGLKPKNADEHMKKQLDAWGQWGNMSHFTGELPAALCDQPGREPTAKLIGASKEEVTLMNGLTVNLNMLLVSPTSLYSTRDYPKVIANYIDAFFPSRHQFPDATVVEIVQITFYRPTAVRNKILMERNPFPSDLYAAQSHIRMHGFDPATSLVFVQPRKGEDSINPADILELIRDEGDTIALIMFSGVDYFTGQRFDLEAITAAGHEKGCIVGYDLAHSIGNVKLELNRWDVDFACWCSYKYLNSGAGGLAGIFVHEKYLLDGRPQLHGWWSNRNETRFEFRSVIDLETGSEGFRISNPPPVLACLNLASLEIFEQTSMDDLICKQFFLAGYLEELLKRSFPRDDESPSKVYVHVITPSNPEERGNQISVRFVNFVASIRTLKCELDRKGILCDCRPPDVLRIGAAPLYVSFADVFKFVEGLKTLLNV